MSLINYYCYLKVYCIIIFNTFFSTFVITTFLNFYVQTVILLNLINCSFQLFIVILLLLTEFCFCFSCTEIYVCNLMWTVPMCTNSNLQNSMEINDICLWTGDGMVILLVYFIIVFFSAMETFTLYMRAINFYCIVSVYLFPDALFIM